jgi:3',5'-cyclic AMP phosphodiesterase CpdA
MPISLPALDRRQFLATSTAAIFAAAQARGADGSSPRKPDPQRFILMADVHMPSKPEMEARGVNMQANFAQAGKDILALQTTPAAAMILGDCAYLHGEAADYALFVKSLEPLRAAGLPVHCAMGNHDHRERFWQALPAEHGEDKYVDSRHLLVLETPRANWFLLDSLDATNKVPGVLGEEQLAWLAKELDARADKPALLALHHNPDLRPKPGGLVDTQPLYDVILPRKQVKALFFGHSHNWHQDVKEGVHLVNLPPTAYVFVAGKPSGFVEIELQDDAAKLRLTALDKQHPQHGQELALKYR